MTSRARDIANFGDGIATADIDDGAVTAAKIGSLPAGSVLQVVHTLYTGATISTSSTSYVDSNIDLSITPSSASNKILIRAFGQFFVDTTAHGKIAIYRNDTFKLVETSVTFDAGDNHGAQAMIETLDSPSTTSATTYSIYILTDSGTGVLNGETDSDCGITAMEIAG